MTAKDGADSEFVCAHGLLDSVGTESESLLENQEQQKHWLIVYCNIGNGTLISCTQPAWIYLTCSAWRRLGMAMLPLP